jgi:hypothetical protein
MLIAGGSIDTFRDEVISGIALLLPTEPCTSNRQVPNAWQMRMASDGCRRGFAISTVRTASSGKLLDPFKTRLPKCSAMSTGLLHVITASLKHAGSSLGASDEHSADWGGANGDATFLSSCSKRHPN